MLLVVYNVFTLFLHYAVLLPVLLKHYYVCNYKYYLDFLHMTIFIQYGIYVHFLILKYPSINKPVICHTVIVIYFCLAYSLYIYIPWWITLYMCSVSRPLSLSQIPLCTHTYRRVQQTLAISTTWRLCV